MTPIYLNSSQNNYSPNPSDLHNEHQFMNPNSQASSSSNSHDQTGGFHRESHQHEGNNFGSQAYDEHQIKNNNDKDDNNDDFKFSLWKKEIDSAKNQNQNQNQVKWMSSKMRVMLKMKKSDLNTFSNINVRDQVKVEDQKSSFSMEETDNSSNCTSSNNNKNIPIRVCSDCNTTKTPLWRSGPRGPKSLCNACGIRQRKARKAMAAMAENGNNNVSICQPIMRSLNVTKHKDKHSTKKYKKRQYSKQLTSKKTSPSSSSSSRKNCVEEFLVSLRKNLAFHHVFPQDEKEAAILLMALSCGYVRE